MAHIVYKNQTEDWTFDLVALATAVDWSPIDHVELHVADLTLVSHNPGEFWRQVKEVAGVVQQA